MDADLIAFVRVRLEEVEDNDDLCQRVLHDVDAQRLVVDAFAEAIAAIRTTEAEAREKPATPAAQPGQSARRWELVGRVDAQAHRIRRHVPSLPIDNDPFCVYPVPGLSLDRISSPNLRIWRFN